MPSKYDENLEKKKKKKNIMASFRESLKYLKIRGRNKLFENNI